jgi:6-pyruvoyltetrahydropterin/6-carboxytetrahydropterin synthase
MFTIAKQFQFSASHQLDRLPPEHQCARLHGHNYVVELILQSETVNEFGFVVDYLDLKPFKAYLDDELDHRHLNELFAFPTSAENLAQHLYNWAKARWPQTIAVRVSETPKTWAEYRTS